jgi:hypothetical protein
MNKSKIYYNRSTWDNKYGNFTIIDKDTKCGYYICKFEDGTILSARKDSIKNGRVNNPNKKSCVGIGFIGIGEFNSSKNDKEYRLWSGILSRCYNKNSISYKNYGAKHVIVDERWHNFQNFCKDIQHFENYIEWKNSKNNYQMDKDILCDKLNIYPKIYSNKTCHFITPKENTCYANVTNKTYIGYNFIQNQTEEFVNQSEFAEKFGLIQSCINNCLLNKNTQHKGWVFYENGMEDSIDLKLAYESYKKSESKKCALVDYNNNILEKYNSLCECAKKQGYINSISNIKDVCEGNTNSINNKIFRYLDENENVINVVNKTRKKRSRICGISIYNKNDILYYNSILEASKKESIERGSLHKCIKGSNKYKNVKKRIWRKVDNENKIIENNFSVEFLLNYYKNKEGK